MPLRPAPVRRRSAILLLLTALAGARAGADSLSSLPDPGYSVLPEDALSGPIPGRIDRIVYPTLGFPSLVAHGDTIRVHFRLERRDDVRFVVRLERAFGVIRNESLLAVRSAVHDPDWGGYRLQALVSTSTSPGTYDVVVEVPSAGLVDRQPGSVKVFDHIPSRFRFVHLADSQYGDPRGVLDPSNENAGDYGPAEILAQELEEIRYLDPAFCVFSGDPSPVPHSGSSSLAESDRARRCVPIVGSYAA